jgi:hypothetical protein
MDVTPLLRSSSDDDCQSHLAGPCLTHVKHSIRDDADAALEEGVADSKGKGARHGAGEAGAAPAADAEGAAEALAAGMGGVTGGVGVGQQADAATHQLLVHVFPYLASCINPQYRFEKCKFKVQKGKIGTARVVAAKQLKVAQAYTLEASLGGTTAGGRREHFRVGDYLQLGRDLMVALARLQVGEEEELCRWMATCTSMAETSK